MTKSRIIELRQTHGWTQERLATESGVGLRTVQRLEAGDDASLETLSRVAEALRVPVRELFSTIEEGALSIRVESLEARTAGQQVARDRISSAWRWIYIGVGVILTLVSFTFAQGLVLFLGYWVGGYMILVAVRRIYLEPHLDAKYPLSRGVQSRRERRRTRATAPSVADAEVSPSAEDLT